MLIWWLPLFRKSQLRRPNSRLAMPLPGTHLQHGLQLLPHLALHNQLQGWMHGKGERDRSGRHMPRTATGLLPFEHSEIEKCKTH